MAAESAIRTAPTNVTRTVTGNFPPITTGALVTISTYTSQADYASEIALDGLQHGSGGYGSPPDPIVVIPGKLAVIEIAPTVGSTSPSPAEIAARVGGQVVTPTPQDSAS